MRKAQLWLICIATSLASSAIYQSGECGEESTQPAVKKQVAGLEISADQLQKHVQILAAPEMEGRGTPRGKRLAIDYLQKQFEELGLQPLFGDEGYVQEIPGRREDDGTPTILGRNLGAWLPGSDAAVKDEVVIVSAHYDHLGIREGEIYPGADDNASGVAMVLEVARSLSRSELRCRRGVAFVCFDLEENLIWGSRWFAAHPPWPLEQVKLFVTADMIGRSLGNLPLPVVFVMGSEHATGLKQMVRDVKVPSGLELALLGVDLVGTRSDYGPFRDQKIPFLFFSTGEHPDYHSPQDLPERIDYPKAARISNVILDVCHHAADIAETPVWTDHPKVDLDEVHALRRISALLLDGERAKNLSAVQKLLVSHVHQKTGEIAARGTITASERSWLVRSAQLLLVSVF